MVWRRSPPSEHYRHMSPTVIHHPRVAWDGALAIVRAVRGPGYEAYARQVHYRLGPDARAAFMESRERIEAAEALLPGDRGASDVEAGRWRVRLEEAMRNEPGLVDEVLALVWGVPY